ncbi:hypothetical protein AB1N83_006550 [Pleurotus pulmonarius]
MPDSNDPVEAAKNAASYTTLVYALLGIYAWEMLFSLDTDWTYIRSPRQARISMMFRFLNRYCLLFALIGLALAFGVASEAACQPLYIASMASHPFWTKSNNVALELASICLTLRVTAGSASGRSVAISIALVFGLLTQAGLLLYVTAPGKAAWMPTQGCVPTTGLSRGVLTIRYTFVTVYSFILFALAGWKYASRSDTMNRLSGQELCCFGAAFAASTTNIIFVRVGLNPVIGILPTILVSVASCRAVALWNDTLQETESIRSTGQPPPPPPPRHPMMSFIGWGVPLSGRSGRSGQDARTSKPPGFQRLGSIAGSVAGSYSEPADSAPSSIILPSLIAPSSAYNTCLSQGPSSRLGPGSDSSARGDCYDPDAQRVAEPERGLV